MTEKDTYVWSIEDHMDEAKIELKERRRKRRELKDEARKHGRFPWSKERKAFWRRQYLNRSPSETLVPETLSAPSLCRHPSPEPSLPPMGVAAPFPGTAFPSDVYGHR